jgi:hypothetical protein
MTAPAVIPVLLADAYQRRAVVLCRLRSHAERRGIVLVTRPHSGRAGVTAPRYPSGFDGKRPKIVRAPRCGARGEWSGPSVSSSGRGRCNPIGRRSSGVSGADCSAGTRQCSTGGWPRRRCRRRSPRAVASRFSPPCRAWRRANLAETSGAAARVSTAAAEPRATRPNRSLKPFHAQGSGIACNATTDFNRSGNPPRVALTEVGI